MRGCEKKEEDNGVEMHDRNMWYKCKIMFYKTSQRKESNRNAIKDSDGPEKTRMTRENESDLKHLIKGNA